MNRRSLKILVLGALVTGGLSACNGLNGVQVNSNILGGLGGGFPQAQTNQDILEGSANPGVNPEAPPAVNAEPLSALGNTETAALGTPEAPAVAAPTQPSAPLRKRAEPSVGPSDANAPSFGQSTKTVAGLGDPGRAGLWMETPLVKSRQNARVIAPNGRSIVLTLEPITGDTGAGSRLSIGAMRSLGLPLTELVELRVGPV